MQFYVHDYLIDYLGSAENSADLCCGISLMYSANKHSPWDEELQQFSIYAGTPKGIGLYLDHFLNLSRQVNEDKHMLFFRPLLIAREFDEKTIYEFLKKYIEAQRGDSEAELTLKLMQNFDWVHDNYTIDNEISYLWNKRK